MVLDCNNIENYIITAIKLYKKKSCAKLIAQLSIK